MIQKIELTNFKSHKDTKLDFSNLTVLCGKNSSGKSSVIQALLLLRDARLNQTDFSYINLKSNLVNIGTANDVLYQFADEDKIIFSLTTDEYNDLSLYSPIKDRTKTILPVHFMSEAAICNGIATITEAKISLFENSFQFISAYRLGPQKFYAKNDMIDFHNQISNVAGRAENTIPFLDKKRNNLVYQELCLPGFDSYLIDQVSAWENEISNGVNIFVDEKTNGFELNYQYKGMMNKVNAVNAGFGLTYALPVIVAIFAAPKGAFLVIENPEAHLHPRGQAKLAELICLAAQTGIQIVIETHSDHIFNGIRKAIAAQKIDNKNVKTYFFELQSENTSVGTAIEFSETGRVLNYKEGLFDQFDNDLDELLGL
jgi:predicted ATPase